jgi:hypothetical protein
MWSWLSCFIIGHSYSVHCEPGAVYLRCFSCGRRSHGWMLAHGLRRHG